MVLRPTHSGRLARWLGEEQVAHFSGLVRDWYGPPIALAGVPGSVYACAGGDFAGEVRGGAEVSAVDRAVMRHRQAERERFRYRAILRRQAGMAGLSSVGQIRAAMYKGKGARYDFSKVADSSASAASLWAQPDLPPAGASAANAPGGEAPTSATVGAFPYANPISGLQRFFIEGAAGARNSGAGWFPSSTLLYDRIFSVNKTMNSTATEAVTGVPTRYQSTTRGDPDFAGGNFLFPEVLTVLANTAHNWTVCTYTDQNGNAGATLPLITGVPGLPFGAVDMETSVSTPGPSWFAPLASGDDGIKALTQMQCSALVATGAVNFTIGHPIAFLPWMTKNLPFSGGFVSAFSMARIFDEACLALLHTPTAAGVGKESNGTGWFVTADG